MTKFEPTAKHKTNASVSFATYNMPARMLPSGDPADWEAGERSAFKVVMAIGLTSLAFNFLGCMYVFYRVLKRWRMTKVRAMTMPMSLRLPLYTAMTNFMIFLSGAVNLTYTAVNHKTWQGDDCVMVGAFTFGTATLNIALYAGIALLTYMRVCRDICLEFGRYDYKLWGIVLGGTICTVFAGYGGYGEQKYWCSSRANTPRVGALMFVTVLVINVLVFVCYLLTLRDIRQIDRNTLYGTAAITGVCIERQVARKITSYLLVFFIQWVPVTIYDLARELWDYREPCIYALCAIAINLGGIGTAIQYVLNEGLDVHRPLTIQSFYAPTPSIGTPTIGTPTIGTPTATKHNSINYPASASSLVTLTPPTMTCQQADISDMEPSKMITKRG